MLLILAASAGLWWSDDAPLREQGGRSPVAPDTFHGSVCRGSFSADGSRCTATLGRLVAGQVPTMVASPTGTDLLQTRVNRWMAA